MWSRTSPRHREPLDLAAAYLDAVASKIGDVDDPYLFTASEAASNHRHFRDLSKD